MNHGFEFNNYVDWRPHNPSCTESVILGIQIDTGHMSRVAWWLMELPSRAKHTCLIVTNLNAALQVGRCDRRSRSTVDTCAVHTATVFLTARC